MMDKQKIDKYLGVLKLIYDVLKVTNKVSMSKICVDNDIPYTVIQELKKGGILSSNGGRGAHAVWLWKSKEPDGQMAKELLFRIQNSQDEHDEVSDLNNYVPIISIEEREKERKEANDSYEKHCVDVLKKTGKYKIYRIELIEL